MIFVFPIKSFSEGVTTNSLWLVLCGSVGFLPVMVPVVTVIMVCGGYYNSLEVQHTSNQGCIFRLTCSHPASHLTSLKQTCNEYLIKFSENQSAPKLENRKTSPCSPCAPNLPHVLLSRIPGYHNLCSPGEENLINRTDDLFFSFSLCKIHSRGNTRT